MNIKNLLILLVVGAQIGYASKSTMNFTTLGVGKPSWGTVTGTLSSQSDLNSALNIRELLSNKTTDSAFTANSDTLYPSQRATKSYVDTSIAGLSTFVWPTIPAHKAVITDASGQPTGSAVSSTEIGYLQGVTSSVQTQLNNKLEVASFISQHQEIPSGIVNGVNVNFYTSVTPSTSSSVMLYQDKMIMNPGVDYSVLDNHIIMTVAPVLGQQLFAVYNGTHAGVYAWENESITLVAGDITNQYVDLNYAVVANSLTFSVGGLLQEENIDYTLSTVGGVTRVSFIGAVTPSGISPLIAGNTLNMKYQR